MAQTAPPSQDVQDIQFKLHDRFRIFSEGKDLKSLVSLLAVSSKGLIFAGNANTKELIVIKLQDVVDRKISGQNIRARVINLPGEPKVLACSCDGSMLAVNYVLNNTGFLQIYLVESFVTPTINSLYNLPIAPESNTFALQLLWNPVITTNIALILIDGSVAMFTLHNSGEYDKVTLGKEHQVKSGCWSPKGKQIVFGFAEGKLQQFKPNLQPARVIPCPPDIQPSPFDCIAVHWLSTFQFAAIFLQRGQDMCPSLFLVNAPKTGQPSYINYHDVCYSAPGPRILQLSFSHVAQWNLLLVTSSNGVEVGVLGTNETGETPKWIQYTLLDEARIEMPLTESMEETYPLGFAIDTSSSHQVAIGEKKLPVMPMIHVLSTHGHLISYNFLNLSPNAVDICSPPPPLRLNDLSFFNVSLADGPAATLQEIPSKPSVNTSELAGLNNAQNTGQSFGDIPFTLGSNMVTSTPSIKDKTVALFGSQSAAPKSITGMDSSTATSASSTLTASNTAVATSKPSSGFGFGTPNAAISNEAPFSQQFGGMTAGTSFGSFAAKPGEQNGFTSSQQPMIQSDMNKNTELNKPLYTIPPTYTPPTASQKQSVQTEVKLVKPTVASNKINLNTGEIDEVVKQMIIIQIDAFETELRQIQQQSKQLMTNIGSPEEIKSYTKQLNDLQEIMDQANDHEFEQDVKSLRHSMNEAYAMLAECRTELDLFNNPNLIRLPTASAMDSTNRRQLAKLQAYVASNQNQLYQLNQLIDGQWSQYQDIVRRNSKNQMHIPCLDGIYQRMSKLKDLLSRQRTKMNYIKTKLKQRGLNYKPPSDVDITSAAIGALTKNQSTIESLADSILSMSLSQVVSQTHAKLSEEKLSAIRNFTKRHQQIAIIKPKRPDRVGLKSEVILETKLETERKQKEMAKIQQQQQQYQQQHQFVAYKTPINITNNKKQHQQNYQTQLQQQLLKPQATKQQQPILAKPTASKPSIVSTQPPTFITPTSSTATTLSFGGNSSFVKTSMSVSKSEETSKAVVTSSTPFAGFGVTSQAGLNFIQSKPIINTAAPITNDSKENKIISTPISFSAKVIGGNDAKAFANLGNKTITQSNVKQAPSQGFSASSSTGFSAFATTKSATQAGTLDKDSAKKTEEAPKPFDFATASASTAATTSAPVAFAGFAASTKSPTTTAPFSAPIFGSNTNTSASTPFGVLPSSSVFSFNATVTTSRTTTSTSSANNSTKAVTSTTDSSQPLTVATAESTEIKTPTISSPPVATTTVTDTAASFNSLASSNITGTHFSSTPNATRSSSRMQETKPVESTPTSTTTTMDDPTDSLFGSLNICKPTAKVVADANKAGNIFSGFAAAASTTSTGPYSIASASGAEDGAQSLMSSTTTAGTTANTGFSFVSAGSSTNPPVPGVFEKAATPGIEAAASSVTLTAATSSSLPTIGTATISSTATAAPPTTTTTAATSSLSFGTKPPATAATPDSLFGSLSVSSSIAASSSPANVTATTSASAGNIFGGGSSVFAAATTTTTTSLFGGGAAVTSSAPSLFGSTAPAATTAATPGSGSIFAAAATVSPQSGGSIFGGIPKPEQSVFAASMTTNQTAGTGLFAAAAANSTTAAVTGGSIFGGGTSTGFGRSAAGLIFGGESVAASSPFSPTGSANTSGPIFGATAAGNEPAEGGSIFSSSTQQSSTSGGSIFGKSTFGATTAQQQSPGSIFATGNTQSPTSGGFGTSGGSIFGGSTSANTSASGGSIFAAAAATTAPGFAASNASPGFGSFSQPSTAPAYGSPPAGGFGAPASAGFGSSQQQSAFTKPLFGGPATFGSPQPTFGAQPTFGGAPTFGTSKGFGSFAATSPTTSGFGATAQGTAAPTGNIFETLGSQDSGLSFGNLAHSSQAPQQKPAFGGLSFMNYRS